MTGLPTIRATSAQRTEPFPNTEPWPEPVDGNQVLDTLAATFERYLVLPEGAAEALSLFVEHTYAFDTCWMSPILAITSPVKQCGKTRTQDLLAALVYRPLRAANASPASLYRVIERFHPTLLLDEYDTFVTANDALRGILNSGHTKEAAVVLRCEGADFEPRAYSTWAPKVLSGIGTLPATIQDRSIVIPMKRKHARESVEPLRLSQLSLEMEPMRRRILRWVSDHRTALEQADPHPIADFTDRANDNWSPLLAIADEAGAEWAARARRSARALMAVGDDSHEDLGTLLLTDIRTVFKECRNADRLPSECLATELARLQGRPWAEYGPFARPLSANQLAKLLKEFGITPDKYRDGAQTRRGYGVAGFREAWARYLNGNRESSAVPTG